MSTRRIVINVLLAITLAVTVATWMALVVIPALEATKAERARPPR